MKLSKLIHIGAGVLAATAAAGAVAQQATQVQMYGLIGAYASRSERSGGPAAVTQLGHGGLTTSFWGVRGSEDLGGGLKASFALESFFQTDTGAMGRNGNDGLFSRNAFLALDGGFGKLALGRQTNPTYSNMATLSPFGGSVVFSPLVLHSFIGTYNGALIGDTVWNNAIQYVTPNMSGLTASVIYGLGEQPGSLGTANLGVHAKYARGAFAAAFSAQRVRMLPAAVAPNQQNGYLLGASYDFKVAKVYGSFLKTSTEGTGTDTRTVDVGVKVPVSANGAVLAEWAHTKREVNAVDSKRNTASIGYDHFLSKRTDVYAIYSHDKQSGFDSAGTIGFGVRHTF